MVVGSPSKLFTSSLPTVAKPLLAWISPFDALTHFIPPGQGHCQRFLGRRRREPLDATKSRSGSRRTPCPHGPATPLLRLYRPARPARKIVGAVPGLHLGRWRGFPAHRQAVDCNGRVRSLLGI